MPIETPKQIFTTEKSAEKDVLKQQLVFHKPDELAAACAGRVNVLPDRTTIINARLKQRRRKLFLLGVLLSMLMIGVSLLIMFAMLRRNGHFFGWGGTSQHRHRLRSMIRINLENERCKIREYYRFYSSRHPFHTAILPRVRNFAESRALHLKTAKGYVTVVRTGQQCYMRPMSRANRRAFYLTLKWKRNSKSNENLTKRLGGLAIYAYSRPARFYHEKWPLTMNALRALLRGDEHMIKQHNPDYLYQHVRRLCASGEHPKSTVNIFLLRRYKRQNRHRNLSRHQQQKRLNTESAAVAVMPVRSCPVASCVPCPAGQEMVSEIDPSTNCPKLCNCKNIADIKKTDCPIAKCKACPAGMKMSNKIDLATGCPKLCHCVNDENQKLNRHRRSDSASASHEKSCKKEIEFLEGIIPQKTVQVMPRIIVDECD